MGCRSHETKMRQTYIISDKSEIGRDINYYVTADKGKTFWKAESDMEWIEW